jgi:hypothetical protein
MRFLRPTADECILHDRLPRNSAVQVGFSRGVRAFRRKRSGNHAPKPLGNQANFVINFCQILFEAKSTEIATGRRA